MIAVFASDNTVSEAASLAGVVRSHRSRMAASKSSLGSDECDRTRKR